MKRLIRLPYRVARKAYRIIIPKIDKVTNSSAEKAYERAASAALKNVDGRALQAKLNILVEEIWNERFTASVASRYQNIDEYIKHIESVKKKRNKSKVAIFTAVSGSYESIKLPEVFTENADYYVFTDDKSLKLPDIYNVILLPYFNADAVRIARYAKTHPHILLKDYETVVWLDSNITPTTALSKFIEAFNKSQKDIALVNHPLRKSVAEEADACIKRSKDDAEIIQKQVANYGKTASDESLFESSFYIANLTSDNIKKMFDEWWKELDNWSRRDQLSLPIAIKRTRTSVFSIFPSTKSVRNNPDFILNPHDSIANKLTDALINRLLHSQAATRPKHQALGSAKPSSKLDVIVCVHNAPEETKACLEAVVRHTKYLNKLIIVDDGSEKKTQEVLKSFKNQNKNVQLVRNEEAQRYTKAANKGLRLVEAEYAALLNSDTVVTQNWDEKMIGVLNARYDIAVVGPLSNAASMQSIPDYRSKNQQTAINTLPKNVTIDGMNKYVEQWAEELPLIQTQLVHGFCYMIRSEILKTVGYLDEESFPRGYGEENDYCFRVTNAGYSLAIAPNTYVYHKKSASYPSEERVKLMRDGRRALLTKHTERRVNNAVESMRLHPLLVHMRDKAKSLY